jgi:hypothetical protein
MPAKRAVLGVALLVALFGTAHAETPPYPQASSDQSSNDDALSRKATDPTASLMSFQISDWYTASLHGVDGSANQIVARIALPFEISGVANIFRVTLPYVTSSPGTGSAVSDTTDIAVPLPRSNGPDGLSDTTVFDIAVFSERWGRWGVGAAGSLPTGTNGLTQEKWTLGPAAGFVNSTSKQYNWGLFLQRAFAVTRE